MKIIVYNNSRKKRFRTTKRIVSSLLPSVNPRLNIGRLPRRVIEQLICDLKKHSGRGCYIEIYIENNNGYHGFEIVNIGKKSPNLELFSINSKF